LAHANRQPAQSTQPDERLINWPRVAESLRKPTSAQPGNKDIKGLNPALHDI
jgi:hypothetical protein